MIPTGEDISKLDCILEMKYLNYNSSKPMYTNFCYVQYTPYDYNMPILYASLRPN